MKLTPNQIYHVYNRGNNKQAIFFEDENYHFFLKKVKIFLSPYCDILAYSLMPNHFHFLIYTNEISCRRYRRINLPKRKRWKKPHLKMSLFAHGLQQLLSSYTKGINIRYDRTGSLFQQNTKARKTSNDSYLDDYSLWCFSYIHNNAKLAGLVDAADAYKFSSLSAYLNHKEDSICNLELGRRLLSLDKIDLFSIPEMNDTNKAIKQIFR